jgi:CRISPR-associated protein Csh2
VPFAVFAMPGIINANIARETMMTENDVELLLEGLWNGTRIRQARGRGIQQPLLLIHVEYNDPMYRIGYLEESIKLVVESQLETPTKLDEIEIDVSDLTKILEGNWDKIKQVRYWLDPRIVIIGQLQGKRCEEW